MRLPTAIRAFAALLAFTAALASPAVALAHGVAHEHETASAHAHADGSHGAYATAVSPAEDADAPHPGLHAGCAAKLASAMGLALRSTPIVVPSLARVVAAGKTPPAETCAAAPSRAAPPDQPRAPPIH